jgi:hypothetical protein
MRHDAPYDVAYDALIECESRSGDGRLDLAQACADGVCEGQDWDTISAAAGGAVCTPDGDQLVCIWGDDEIVTTFADTDYDSIPDTNAPAGMVRVLDPWDGTTLDGIGPGSAGLCVLDRYGHPTTVDFQAHAGELRIIELLYLDHMRVALDPETTRVVHIDVQRPLRGGL